MRAHPSVAEDLQLLNIGMLTYCLGYSTPRLSLAQDLQGSKRGGLSSAEVLACAQDEGRLDQENSSW